MATKVMISTAMNRILSSTPSIARNSVQVRTYGILSKNIGVQSSIISPPPLHSKQQIRFRRKGGARGQHLAHLEELAHRPEHENSKNKKNATKANHDDTDEVQTDENESNFDASPEIEGEESGPSLPDPEEVKIRMGRVISSFGTYLKNIRGSEVTPEMFDRILVDAYDALTPLSAVAQVTIPQANLAVVTSYDPAVTSKVRDAIRDSGMNFNPRIEDGTSVIVPIPKVSMDTRKLLVKDLTRQAEKFRARIRKIRRGAMDVAKKGQLQKLEGISKDEAFRVGKEVEGVTEELISILDRMVKEKSEDVLNV